MDEFPNEDEEFELMYGDELELLREQDDPDIPSNKSRRTLDFTQNTQENVVNHINNTLVSQQSHNDSFENNFSPLEINVETTQNDNNRKRPRVDDLFGDITDIIDDNDDVINNQSKKYKCDQRTADLQLIEHILELRKLNKIKNNPVLLDKDYRTNNQDCDQYSLSLTIPKYPFIGITRMDGERIYVRFHSEQYEKEEIQRLVNGIYTNNAVMGDHFKNIWEEAKVLINRSLDKSAETTQTVNNQQNVNNNEDDNSQLWVELYRPRKYVELLSDESTNRIMLRWLKLWDKVVFNRPIKIKNKPNNSMKSFSKQPELDTNLDEYGRPKFKVALLCGPPGLGKTTLAHVVAKHAGYNVVEINASDDRNIDNFKTILEHSTQMRSILDKENRPNCIIFDEIDGAPQSSIDYLVKFINGNNPKTTTTTTTKKKSSTTKQQILKRPIICICNDVYVSTLRSLRQIAFIINFPQTLTNRLAERLMVIAQRQNVRTDYGSMLTLAEKSNNDIRSCLSILHFYKIQNKPITINEIYKTTIGQKDIKKNLFSIWNEIFFIDRTSIKKQFFNNNTNNNNNASTTLKVRMANILNFINNFGDYERLAQGVYENFPNLNIIDTKLLNTSTSLEWFCWMDILNQQIYSNQDYSLLNYLQYCFVVWHFAFASTNWQKLQYPSVGYEAKLKETRRQAIINELMHGIQSTIRPYIQPTSLILDILPLISIIIVPKLRPVNLHLYTKDEKNDLDNVVNIMIDYNLNYLQERTIDGNYVYKLDPNIEEIVDFTKDRLNRQKNLSYSNKQMISREIELMKMRKFEKTLPENLPNHLQKLKAKSVQPIKKKQTSPKTRDFFGRIIVKSPPKGGGKFGVDAKNDIWYQYKEGYSNAVKKTIKISSLK